MRYVKRQHIPWICLAVIALAMYGCSFIYVIQVDGRVVSGTDQAPVAGAIISIGPGLGEGTICTTDEDGNWRFRTSKTGPSSDRDAAGNSVIVLPLEIEAHGNVFHVIATIPVPDRGRSINGFVLTVLELGSTK